MSQRRNLTIVLLVAMALPAATLRAGIKPETRMAIIRGLTAEYANLRVPLPRGKKGLVLSSDGKVDEQSLRKEITQNGTAIAPNNLVQLTAIGIENKSIVVEINGGGKSKSKWYQHIEVGMGNSTRPISQENENPTGSFITLGFPKNLEDRFPKTSKTSPSKRSRII